MTSFTITVQDQAVQAALQALAARVGDLAGPLKAIGEDITARTQRRFDTSTGPDGAPWRPNSEATLAMLAGRLAGVKSNALKNGGLNKRGRAQLAGKKPLIGESKSLRQQIFPTVSGNTLTVGSSMAYAAIQQFGGTTGARSWIPGKAIPARPFLPVRLDGTLYPQEQALVLAALNDFLAEGL